MGDSTLLEANEVRGQRATLRAAHQARAVHARVHARVPAPGRFSYRIDERVRRLDVAEGRVQRQTEADGVVQTGLKANGSGQNRVPEGTHNVANVQTQAALRRGWRALP